jgi:poly(3-hydroxybutyrate) depolymerase
VTITDKSTIEHYKYFCKDSNLRVELLKVINGGHTFPLIDAPYLPSEWREALGNTNKDLDSPLLVLDFFESLR